MLIEIEVRDLGTVLRKARESAGTSLTDAAEQARMDFDNLNRIETEKDLAVPLETLVRVAKAVNVDLSQAVGDWVEMVQVEPPTKAS